MIIGDLLRSTYTRLSMKPGLPVPVKTMSLFITFVNFCGLANCADEPPAATVETEAEPGPGPAPPADAPPPIGVGGGDDDAMEDKVLNRLLDPCDGMMAACINKSKKDKLLDAVIFRTRARPPSLMGADAEAESLLKIKSA